MKDQILLLLTAIIVAVLSWVVLHTMGDYWFYFSGVMLVVLLYSIVKKWLKNRR